MRTWQTRRPTINDSITERVLIKAERGGAEIVKYEDVLPGQEWAKLEIPRLSDDPPYRPKTEEAYYTLFWGDEMVYKLYWWDDDIDVDLWNSNNVFATQEQARDALMILMIQLKY